jgi:hypothetical protein
VAAHRRVKIFKEFEIIYNSVAPTLKKSRYGGRKPADQGKKTGSSGFNPGIKASTSGIKDSNSG